MRKYVRDGLEDTYGILDYQEELLKIMVYIDAFCETNGIDYCLMAGSALGAERHQGFIPWDDDIDIYMSVSGYKRFKKAFVEKGDKNKYYLQEYGKTKYKNNEMITMAKFKLNGSMIEEEIVKGWKIHQGIFVDIFIIHNSPRNRVKRVIQYFWTEAVVLKGLSIRCYKSKGWKDSVALSFAKLIPKKWILDHGLYNAYKYDEMHTPFFNGFFANRKYSRAVFTRNMIFPAKYNQFENVKLKVPAMNKEYLTTVFGEDYMRLPPIEERPINKHTKCWKIDDTIRYEYSDETKLI